MSWNYAVLSHTAKECGGPEALMEIIESKGFQEGFWAGAEAGIKEGRIQMIPIILLALAGSAAVTIAVQNRKKILSFCETKFGRITQEEYEAAKEALVQGIEDYDKGHSEVEPAAELAESPNATTD